MALLLYSVRARGRKEDDNDETKNYANNSCGNMYSYFDWRGFDDLDAPRQ